MPLSALRNVPMDYRLPLREIPSTLMALAQVPAIARPGSGVLEEAALESKFTKITVGGRALLERFGKPSTVTGPDCQGPPWELGDGKLFQYLCHVGHGFSSSTVLTSQQEVVERPLWMALGAIEAHLGFCQKLATRLERPGLLDALGHYRARERQAREDADVLRKLLLRPNAETHFPPPGRAAFPVPIRKQRSLEFSDCEAAPEGVRPLRCALRDHQDPAGHALHFVKEARIPVLALLREADPESLPR